MVGTEIRGTYNGKLDLFLYTDFNKEKYGVGGDLNLRPSGYETVSNKESQSCPALIRAYKGRKHCPIFGR